ncbi:MAG: hypothetical protein R2766_01090 [Saprospiraceae bacterium]
MTIEYEPEFNPTDFGLEFGVNQLDVMIHGCLFQLDWNLYEPLQPFTESNNFVLFVRGTLSDGSALH